MCKCLYCYRPLNPGEMGFHPACAKKFFGTKELPAIDVSKELIQTLAIESTTKGYTVPGVQKKLSLHCFFLSCWKFRYASKEFFVDRNRSK